MAFTKRYPSGVPALQVISPADFEYWDTSISQAVDGTGGGTYSGAIELTGALLSGTSAIDTTGNITTEQDITGANIIATQTFTGEEVAAVLLLATDLYAYRSRPRAVGSQAIVTTTATVLALNFTTRDTWEITLENGVDPTLPAVLSTTATLVDTVASPGDPGEVVPGSKMSITFRPSAAQTGGIGVSSSATVFPASFHGLTKADLVGPRTGANDWIRLELENIGTALVPKYACKWTMGID